jgi:hypothetical protein
MSLQDAYALRAQQNNDPLQRGLSAGQSAYHGGNSINLEELNRSLSENAAQAARQRMIAANAASGQAIGQIPASGQSSSVYDYLHGRSGYPTQTGQTQTPYEQRYNVGPNTQSSIATQAANSPSKMGSASSSGYSAGAMPEQSTMSKLIGTLGPAYLMYNIADKTGAVKGISDAYKAYNTPAPAQATPVHTPTVQETPLAPMSDAPASSAAPAAADATAPTTATRSMAPQSSTAADTTATGTTSTTGMGAEADAVAQEEAAQYEAYAASQAAAEEEAAVAAASETAPWWETAATWVMSLFADGGQVHGNHGLSAAAKHQNFNLGSYSDGGRLLKGPGDGVSDSIPATIGHKQQPARLADGEFVVPARIVSELGNGSTEAGARKLYAMMDRVQATRKKSIGKGKVAVNSRADKNLPA